jgi:hypothetical protein
VAGLCPDCSTARSGVRSCRRVPVAILRTATLTDSYSGQVTAGSSLPSPRHVRRAYRDELQARERSVLWSWVGFTATFAAVRVIAYSIRGGVGPFHNLRVGGAHLHHYMWGIGILSGVGAVAVAGEEPRRRHPVTAAAYGAGLALIVDEFALLLDLKDVYWAKQGRSSVDLGVGLIALGGIGLSARPIVGRLIRDLCKEKSPDS